ncbi:MAG: DUF433 domain-containing protein [Alphaproteobacteria bacterium]|nr:DUF433 domain-containing protein [Alphaproteobacteria bacterium]
MKLPDRITVDPAVMTGKPCLRGYRLRVATVLGLLAVGTSRDEILRSYPFLEASDMDATLAYAAWRTQEYDAPIAPAA